MASRSDLVYATLRTTPLNRFALCRFAAKGVRKLHTPEHRVADSMNKALRFASTVKEVPMRGVA